MFVKKLLILLVAFQCLSSLYAFENDGSYESSSASAIEEGQQDFNQQEPDKREISLAELSNKSSMMKKELMDRIRKLMSSPSRLAFKNSFNRASSKQENTSRDQTGVTSRIKYYMNRLGPAKPQAAKRFYDAPFDSASFEENSSADDSFVAKRSSLRMTKKTQPKSPSWLKDFLTIRY